MQPLSTLTLSRGHTVHRGTQLMLWVCQEYKMIDQTCVFRRVISISHKTTPSSTGQCEGTEKLATKNPQ